MQGFGISIKGIVDSNAGDVKGIVIDMANALDTLDPLNRARAIEQMFGKFQFARISTLFQNVVKEGSQASTVLGLTKATSQELAILSERELKKVEDSPMFKFQKAIEDIKTSLVPLGEQFLKLVTPIIEFGTKALEQFNKLDSGVKNFIMGAIGVLGGLAPAAIMAFGLIANGIANLIKTGNFLRGIFVRAGQGTTILGQQTQYMTNEQLEAAAAAASLNQAHQKLTQQFTVETTAVRKLAAAYNDAAIAGARLTASGAVSRGRGGSGGGKAKGYKTGVLSVPGPKGAGDVVPAMLAPGEAVIPADKAQKYRGFIYDMMQDRLPGFEGGTAGIGIDKEKNSITFGNSVVYAKNREALERMEVQIKKLDKEYGPAGRDISGKTLEFLKEQRVDANTFKKYLVTFGERVHSKPANATGRLLGETPDQQERLRGAPTSLGNYDTYLEERSKTDKDLATNLKIFRNMNQQFYEEMRDDPQTQKEFKAWLKKVSVPLPTTREQDIEKYKKEGLNDKQIKKNLEKRKDHDRFAQYKKAGLSDKDIEQRELVRKAIAITNFDPENPKTFSGMARGHLGGLPEYIKRFVAGWGYPFVSPDTRTINGYISSLVNKKTGKDTAPMLALIKANDKAKVEGGDELIKKLRSNGTLSPKELETLGKLSRTATDMGLIDNRNMRVIGKVLGRIDLTKMVDTSAGVPTDKKSIDKAVDKFILDGPEEAKVVKQKPRTTKRYAKGVVSVPGPKGAGDVVPAMLSPGEAVIPAAMSKKYAPLIAGMVTDTLPGYNKGYDPNRDPGLGGSRSFGQKIAMVTGKVMGSAFVKATAPVIKNAVAGIKDTAVNSLTKEGRLINQATKDAKIAAKMGYTADASGSVRNKSGQFVSKDQVRQAVADKKAQRQQASGRMAQGAMGLSFATGALTMVPGAVGQAAQAAMGPLAGLSAAMALIPGPAGLIVGVLAAVGIGLMQMKANLDDFKKEASATAKTLSS
jgi:hypothetical protein